VVGSVGKGGGNVVVTTHDLVKDSDNEHVLSIIVEDEEVPYPDLVNGRTSSNCW
jgi:hypothetical protein